MSFVVQAAAFDERNRALEAMAAMHQASLEAKQAEWRAEVEMLSRHYTTADTLTELTARVQHGSSFLDELQVESPLSFEAPAETAVELKGAC